MLKQLRPEGTSVPVGLISTSSNTVVTFELRLVRMNPSLVKGKMFHDHFVQVHKPYIYSDNGDLGVFQWRSLGGIGSLNDYYTHTTDMFELASQAQIFKIGTLPLTSRT